MAILHSSKGRPGKLETRIYSYALRGHDNLHLAAAESAFKASQGRMPFRFAVFGEQSNGAAKKAGIPCAPQAKFIPSYPDSISCASCRSRKGRDHCGRSSEPHARTDGWPRLRPRPHRPPPRLIPAPPSAADVLRFPAAHRTPTDRRCSATDHSPESLRNCVNRKAAASCRVERPLKRVADRARGSGP